MVATPFKGTLTMKNLTTGEVAVQPFTASDVDGEYVQFTNTVNNFVNAPGSPSDTVIISDIVLSASGMDTSQLNLRVSQQDTGITFLDAVLTSSVQDRIKEPVLIRGGSSVQLKQVA